MKLFFNAGTILFMFSFLFGCSSFGYQSPRYVKLAHEITEKTAKELKAQKNLYLVGTGGQMMDNIQMMAMSFNYYQEVNLEQARELLIYVINEYISDINNNQDVRPYLHEYPFHSKNVEIRIFIYGPDKRKLLQDKIGYISSIGGVLEYYTGADDDHPICKETYTEALSEIAFSQGLETGPRNTNEEKIVVAEAVARDGAKVSVTVDSFKYSIYQLSGEGFKPHESLNCISTSCDEVLYFQLKANKNGELSGVGLMPAVIGKSGGIYRIDVLRESSPIHIKYPWGSEALKN